MTKEIEIKQVVGQTSAATVSQSVGQPTATVSQSITSRGGTTYYYDANYVHTQRSASKVWQVAHNLEKYPSCTVVDSGGNVVIGEILYIDENNCELRFSAPFGGRAFFN